MQRCWSGGAGSWYAKTDEFGGRPMTNLALSGSLEGLKILTVGDLARYKSAVTAGKQMGWG